MFYLADEKHKSITGAVVELKGLLYFKQDRSGYDGKATKDHVKQNPDAFKEFKKLHPDYVLPESFSDVEVGAPSVVVSPVVVEALVEAAEVSE